MTETGYDTPDDEDLYEHYRIEVDKGQGLLRVDKYLMVRIENATRSKIQLAIESEAVRVNGQVVKPSYRVKPQDLITVSLPHPPREATEVLPENIPLDIVFEDDDLLLVNKPAGLVVHPAQGNWSGTLVNGLVFHLQNLPTSRNGAIRPGLVHRIDKDTSGLLVVAKTELAMAHLARQFFVHTIERTYLALVWGEPTPPEGTITGNVGRSTRDRRVMDVFPHGDQGKEAVTHYKMVQPLRYVSLVQCNLETGRTHQIRVHMKYRGNPLFNDATYGGDRVVKGTVFSKYRQFVENCFQLCPRQALHARSLGFQHPRTGQWMHFEVPLPDDIRAVLAKWEGYVTNE